MPKTNDERKPIIVAADWFGKGPAAARKLKPGEQPPQIHVEEEPVTDQPDATPRVDRGRNEKAAP